ncbi:FecR family protein [Chitinophaga sp. ARDCPP14]|uniref:FecR family protein n=1 Tax=Chitinophaga sp. ARDCPP14 TaxID=3391139 RepID=UPI003F51C0FB
MENTSKHLVIAQLIARQLAGNITPAEQQQLQAWKKEDPAHEQLWQQLTHPGYLDERVTALGETENKTAFDKLMMQVRHLDAAPGIPVLTRNSRRRWLQYAAIAMPLLAAISMGWYLRGKQASPPAVYPVNGTGREGAPAAWQQLVTPKGMEDKVVLPDGSHVWVGAATSLRFPATFSGKERRVELDGEAYFEIAADPQHPFVVHTSKTTVQVLGTAFNIKAYKGERYERTTLVSGAVKVSAANSTNSRLLAPGQQAVVNGAIAVESTDVDAALAWKRGVFIFRSEKLSDILEELSRWYNVVIVTESSVDGNAHFTGRIIRSEQLDDILQFLEATGKVHFSREGQLLRVSAGRRKTD